MDPTIWQLVIAFLSGALLGALLLWLWNRGRLTLLTDRLERSAERLALQQAGQRENEQLRAELAEAKAQRAADTERLAWIHTADEQLRSSFQALAGEVLQHSSQSLVERSREQLRHAVEPMEKALGTLDGRVREVEKERRGAYEGLKQEIGLLREAHSALQSTTVGLQQALKSSSVRGRWGEVQLRRVVEMAGLVEHVDFTEQLTVEGLRPDMIVHLSNGGVLPIDAKAPMKAYLEATEATDETQRRSSLAAHVKALRQRTTELGQRRYWDQFDSAPDFVVLFVPNEACLGSAFERDPGYLDFALGHRVLPATPVTLLALLKSVSYGWQQQRVAENAREIAASGRQLHDRLVRFLSHLERLGKSLSGSTQAYNQALGSLERRVLPSARRLEEVGAALDTAPDLEPIQEAVRSAQVGGRSED
ncbi:MAG: DNA recombination protein RmuC [Acidobacteriota bacterium]